jgi:hypothetical protein
MRIIRVLGTKCRRVPLGVEMRQWIMMPIKKVIDVRLAADKAGAESTIITEDYSSLLTVIIDARII